MYLAVDPDSLTIVYSHSFPPMGATSCCDDNTPIQAPTLLSNGDIVTAREFAGPTGAGALYRLTPTGIVALQEFDDVNVNSTPRFSNPMGGMANGHVDEAPNGMIMGTTTYGGAHGAGVIYEIARDGTRANALYSFHPDGPSYPYGGLTTASNGKLYGASFNGGALFSFYPPTSSCTGM